MKKFENKNLIFSIIISIILTLSFNIKSYSQPYYFKTIFNVEKNNYKIIKIDLSSNSTETFIDNVKDIIRVFPDLKQSWLFLEYEDRLDVYRISDKLLIKTLFEHKKKFNGIDGIFCSYQHKKIFLTWLMKYGENLNSKTEIYRIPSFEKIESTPFAISFNSILSKDRNFIYQYGVDSTGNSFIYKYSIDANKLISIISFDKIIPEKKDKIIEYGKNGMVLISCNSSTSKNSGKEYIVYDLDINKTVSSIFYPYRSIGYISPNNKYIIIQQTPWNPKNITGEEITGKISIFKLNSGNLISNLNLQSEGKILLYYDFPNMLYYYNENDNSTVYLDLLDLPIKNNLSSLVKLRIIQTDSLNKFSYTITNIDTSSQAIKNIYVENKGSVTSVKLPSGWIKINSVSKYNLIGFNSKSDGILRGTELNGFEITTNGLPTIGKIYLQSGRSEIDSSDIYGNSYVVETLVPTQKHAEFNAVKFVDTLIYYNSKSLSNNWLSAEWVKNVIENSLNNAKMFTGKKLYTRAIPVIQQLISILDSYKTSGFLTAESYYLLKINSQYFLEKLNILAVTPPK